MSNGQMDITAHRQTYAAFIKMTMIGFAATVGVLVMIGLLTLR